MNKKIIAVMGATGHIGQVIVDDLLKRGHVIRAIGRNEKKLRTLLGHGSEIYMYDFDDVEGLTEAFQDCYSVFCMIPPDMKVDEEVYQDKVGEATCQALKNANVQRVVNLSSLGADLPDRTGPIKGLYRQEKRLNNLDFIKDLIHLRAGAFMENISSSISTILYENEIALPLKANIPIYMVATRDIGWKAADFLERTDTVGHVVFDFVGPKEITYEDVTNILGQTFDIPNLMYVQINYEDERDQMLRAGMNPKTVELMLEMYEAINENRIKPTQKLTQEHRGRTSFDEFAHMYHHRLLAMSR